jgi:tetratricopeptide (TPR) repeat protein
MKKMILIMGILICFIAIPILAQEGIADSVAKYMALGDELADKWDHQGAANAYLEVLKYDPDNYRALWKAGDEYTEIADKSDVKHQKESMFSQAKTLCEKAIAVNPDGWEGHFRLAVALGRLALFRGGKEKIRLSKRVKAEGDTAVILNPEADLAYHLLGRWHQNIANLSGFLKFFAKVLYGGVPPGTNEEAVALFQKAIEINPEHIEHHIELARTYEFMGKKELMREPLEKALSLPVNEEDDPTFKKEAEEMLKKLK